MFIQLDLISMVSIELRDYGNGPGTGNPNSTLFIGPHRSNRSGDGINLTGALSTISDMRHKVQDPWDTLSCWHRGASRLTSLKTGDSGSLMPILARIEEYCLDESTSDKNLPIHASACSGKHHFLDTPERPVISGSGR